MRKLVPYLYVYEALHVDRSCMCTNLSRILKCKPSCIIIGKECSTSGLWTKSGPWWHVIQSMWRPQVQKFGSKGVMATLPCCQSSWPVESPGPCPACQTNHLIPALRARQTWCWASGPSSTTQEQCQAPGLIPVQGARSAWHWAPRAQSWYMETGKAGARPQGPIPVHKNKLGQCWAPRAQSFCMGPGGAALGSRFWCQYTGLDPASFILQQNR